MPDRPRVAIFAIIGLAVAGALVPAMAQPPSGGSISIEPANAEAPPLPPSIAISVGDALAARGFTVIEDPGHSAYVAELALRQADVGTGTVKVARDRNQVLPGMTPGVGAGVSIPLASGKSALIALRRTELDVRIRRRGDRVAVWQGTAMTVRPAGDVGALASELATALLRSYPAMPQGVLGIP